MTRFFLFVFLISSLGEESYLSLSGFKLKAGVTMFLTIQTNFAQSLIFCIIFVFDYLLLFFF